MCESAFVMLDRFIADFERKKLEGAQLLAAAVQEIAEIKRLQVEYTREIAEDQDIQGRLTSLLEHAKARLALCTTRQIRIAGDIARIRTQRASYGMSWEAVSNTYVMTLVCVCVWGDRAAQLSVLNERLVSATVAYKLSVPGAPVNEEPTP